MENHQDNIPLPEQKEGVKKNIETTVQCNDAREAKTLYNDAKRKLQDVNNWDKISGKLSAVFKLTDTHGNEVDGDVKVGNYFKIDIPGPGTDAGKGYDWVRVEEVRVEKDDEKDMECILVRVRPASDPRNDEDNVAHFFTDKTTSNFVVKREMNIVTAAVYGRNEVPNTSTDNLIDKVRNAIIGISAEAGLSDPQWKALVNGLLNKH